jgi:hypothetical protein
MDASLNEMGALRQARLAELPTRLGPPDAKSPDYSKAPALDSAAEADPASAGDQSFTDLGHVLEQRSREWAAMVRELERRRQHLAFAQAEQDLACDRLGRIVPVVQDTYASLKNAIEARQSGRAGDLVDEIATMHTRAVEELEKLAGTLNAQAIWHRTAWEQYRDTVESARRLRSQMADPSRA